MTGVHGLGEGIPSQESLAAILADVVASPGSEEWLILLSDRGVDMYSRSLVLDRLGEKLRSPGIEAGV